MRTSLVLIAAALMACGNVVVTASGIPSAAPSRPNILFILCDDLGYGDIGVCYQNSRKAQPSMTTPHLDTFAAGGIRLDNHYCGAPVCAPSRASLLSGRHQGNCNIRDNEFDWPLDNNHTLASVLRQAGYTTAIIGKYGLQGQGHYAADAPAHPLKRGFNYFFGNTDHASGHHHYSNKIPDPQRGVYENYRHVTSLVGNCYSTDLLTARAKSWIVEHKQKSPANPSSCTWR